MPMNKGSSPVISFRDTKQFQEAARDAAFRKETEDNIARYGVSLVGVFVDRTNPTPWVYTIGLHQRGFPELIMVGDDGRVFGSVLNGLAKQIIDHQTDFKHGDSFRFPGARFPLRFGTVQPHVAKKWGVQAYRHYEGESVRFQQVIVPDVNGVYPYERGCSEWFSERNQVLICERKGL